MKNNRETNEIIIAISQKNFVLSISIHLSTKQQRIKEQIEVGIKMIKQIKTPLNPPTITREKE